MYSTVHCEKRLAIFPSPAAGRHLPNFPWPGKIKLFTARESLVPVSDIPAGDRKIVDLFYSVLCRYTVCKPEV